MPNAYPLRVSTYAGQISLAQGGSAIPLKDVAGVQYLVAHREARGHIAIGGNSFVRVLAVMALLSVGFLASGCSYFLKINQKSYQSLVAAAPIDPVVIKAATDTSDATQFKKAIGLVLIDSAQKCDLFTKNLTISNIGSNTLLDVTSTVFSAAATAFTPINTIHALTAVSTVSSGSKTAINSDVFAKATIANLAQAVNATYYRDLKAYEDQLVTASNDGIVVAIEVTKVLSIHKECALDTAEATISSTLGTPQPAASATTTAKLVTITLTGAASNAGDVIQIVATSTADPTLKLTASYTVVVNDTPIIIAAGLANFIQTDKGFTQANITATINSAPNDNAFTVQAPAASGIALTEGSSPHAAEKVTITDSKSTGQSGSPSAATKGVVPGRAISLN